MTWSMINCTYLSSLWPNNISIIYYITTYSSNHSSMELHISIMFTIQLLFWPTLNAAPGRGLNSDLPLGFFRGWESCLEQLEKSSTTRRFSIATFWLQEGTITAIVTVVNYRFRGFRGQDAWEIRFIGRCSDHRKMWGWISRLICMRPLLTLLRVQHWIRRTTHWPNLPLSSKFGVPSFDPDLHVWVKVTIPKVGLSHPSSRSCFAFCYHGGVSCLPCFWSTDHMVFPMNVPTH